MGLGRSGPIQDLRQGQNSRSSVKLGSAEAQKKHPNQTNPTPNKRSSKSLNRLNPKPVAWRLESKVEGGNGYSVATTATRVSGGMESQW